MLARIAQEQTEKMHRVGVFRLDDQDLTVEHRSVIRPPCPMVRKSSLKQCGNGRMRGDDERRQRRALPAANVRAIFVAQSVHWLCSSSSL